jgi:hypothetical protein
MSEGLGAGSAAAKLPADAFVLAAAAGTDCGALGVATVWRPRDSFGSEAWWAVSIAITTNSAKPNASSKPFSLRRSGV